ncbi:hypothetical protein [Roseibium sp. SCP14]
MEITCVNVYLRLQIGHGQIHLLLLALFSRRATGPDRMFRHDSPIRYP